jgi:ketosteroid isomerase-like protein
VSNQTQVVRDLYAAFERRDVGAVLRGFDGDIEVYQSEALPWGGTYRGTMAAGTFFQRLAASVDATVTAEDFFDAGNTVVAIARTRGRVRSNDVRFDLRSVHVWTIREGKAVGIQFYLDTPAMLAALEQAPTGD